MATKYHFLPEKSDIDFGEILNAQYSNLNLNHNFQSFHSDNGQSKSALNNSRENEKYEFTDSIDLQRDLRLWNKSNKDLSTNFLKINREFEDEHEFKKSKSINSSTLSLHIAAYENSVEADTSDLNGGKTEGLKSKTVKTALIKRYGILKQIYIDSPSFITNPFEFPRQQKDQSNSPEILQFRASQRLRNPNKENAGDNERVKKVVPSLEQSSHPPKLVRQQQSDNREAMTADSPPQNRTSARLNRGTKRHLDDFVYYEEAKRKKLDKELKPLNKTPKTSEAPKTPSKRSKTPSEPKIVSPFINESKPPSRNQRISPLIIKRNQAGKNQHVSPLENELKPSAKKEFVSPVSITQPKPSVKKERVSLLENRPKPLAKNPLVSGTKPSAKDQPVSPLIKNMPKQPAKLVFIRPPPRQSTIRFLKPHVHSICPKPQTSSDAAKVAALKDALFIKRPPPSVSMPSNGSIIEKENIRLPLQVQTNLRPASGSQSSPSIITFANYPNNLLSFEPNVKYCLVNQNGKLIYPASELEESASQSAPSPSPPTHSLFEPCPNYFLTVL